MSLPDGELETAAEMAAALAALEATATELTERSIRRAEAWQPVGNAFSQLWADEAMARAAETDRSGRAEELPLAGVPVAVKDLFDVAGHETTGCCAAYAGRIAERDAPTIRRVLDAGMVIVGKTNQHELAAGGTNLVSACGPTRNPWDPSRMTGGSSGGSASVVASGVVPWSLGSDTGGSIRIPASFCGIVGLKPTNGELSLEGVMPLAPSLDTPGPMGATVADTWVLFEVLAGRNVRHPARDWLLRRPDRPFRVGIPDPYVTEVIHEEVAVALVEAATVLVNAGVEVDPMDGHGLDDARELWSAVCFPEFADAHPALQHPSLRAKVAPSVAVWLERGAAATETDRERAAIRRMEFERWFRERLALVDALLVPTTPYPAPGMDQEFVELAPDLSVDVATVGPGFITCAVNLAGLPAMSLPVSRTGDGMPVGVSLIGRHGEEETVARIAARWEAASGSVPLRASLPS
jgi:aspartyl-tRNA(Asn)/glutamyl-tRNA(Gln) amidotransferase subunit A